MWKVREWKIEKELEEDVIKEETSRLLIVSMNERAGDGVRVEVSGIGEL